MSLSEKLIAASKSGHTRDVRRLLARGALFTRDKVILKLLFEERAKKMPFVQYTLHAVLGLPSAQLSCTCVATGERASGHALRYTPLLHQHASS